MRAQECELADRHVDSADKLCARNNAQDRRRIEASDKLVAQKFELYLEWAESDKRIIGFNRA